VYLCIPFNSKEKMNRLLDKCFIITLLAMVLAIGCHCESNNSAVISSFFTLDNPAPQFADFHHTEITTGKMLSLNVEKPATVTGQTITPLRLISSFTSLKELLLQQQIHHKLSILNALSDCHFAQKILYGCYTLGLGMMRC
jgi:hypothetical protein